VTEPIQASKCRDAIRRLRSLGTGFSYANVVSTLALFVALGGGVAIAAAVQKNSVKSSSVKNESLRSKDLKDDEAVGTSEVVDDSLGAADLAGGSVGAAEIADGEVGAAEIADGEVGAAEIADGEVGAAELTDSEPAHVVGANGEPAFANGGDNDCVWGDALSAVPGIAPVSYYKDASGRVFFAGVAKSEDGLGGDQVCDNSTPQEGFDDSLALTLPPAYRPSAAEQFVTSNGTDTMIVIVVGQNGLDLGGGANLRAGGVYVGVTNVPVAAQPGGVILSGLSFRVG